MLAAANPTDCTVGDITFEPGARNNWHSHPAGQLLLAHTDWTVSEIAYSLGFGYPTYFNSFFKKQTGTTPLTFRRAHVPVG